MADQRLEYCSACGEPTGNAGAGDGSIFWLDGAIGPLCPECNTALRDEVLDDVSDAVGADELNMAEQLQTADRLLRQIHADADAGRLDFVDLEWMVAADDYVLKYTTQQEKGSH